MLVLNACAPKQDPPPPVWRMSWSCNGGYYCFIHMVPNSYGGAGAFDSSSACVAWESYFLYTAGQYTGSVTACTESN